MKQQSIQKKNFSDKIDLLIKDLDIILGLYNDYKNINIDEELLKKNEEKNYFVFNRIGEKNEKLLPNSNQIPLDFILMFFKAGDTKESPKQKVELLKEKIKSALSKSIFNFDLEKCQQISSNPELLTSNLCPKREQLTNIDDDLKQKFELHLNMLDSTNHEIDGDFNKLSFIMLNLDKNEDEEYFYDKVFPLLQKHFFILNKAELIKKKKYN